MKLYQSPLSPYARKVMVTAHEAGLVGQIELIDGSGTPMAPNAGTLSVNPLGRIPALVTDDGLTLIDSRVICRYLDHLGGTGLYGNADNQFAILAREALAEGMIDSALLVAYEGRLRAEDKRSPEIVAALRAKVLRGAAAFEADMAPMGGPLTVDQIALGSALGYVDFRIPDLGWRDENPALSAWYADFAARPSMMATVPG